MQHFQSAKNALRARTFDIAELLILNLEAKYWESVEIKKQHPEVYRAVRRRLRSHRLDDYLGAQCEIAVASALLRKGFDFTCPDPPDFEIAVGPTKGTAYIECTSLHMEKDSDKDLVYKVGSAISDKKKKPYCTPSTALVIDVTNVIYHSLATDWLLDPDVIRETFGSLASNSGFGAVVILSETLDLESELPRTMYSNLAVENSSDDLSTILNACFPDGRYLLRKAMFARLS